MHWNALIFYAEPRSLIFGGDAIIGVVEVKINECTVTMSSIEYAKVHVSELAKLTWLSRQVIIETAYSPSRMVSVSYFLARIGLPRYTYRVVAADPETAPLKATSNLDILRNIAYLHGVKQIAITKQLHLLSRKTSYAVHKLLLESGYNADRSLADRYRGPIPCRVKLA